MHFYFDLYYKKKEKYNLIKMNWHTNLFNQCGYYKFIDVDVNHAFTVKFKFY